MKKLLLVILSVVLIQPVFAADFAKLRIKLSGALSHNNSYFLCIGNVGCVSIKDGVQGKTYPLTAGPLDYIYTSDVKHLRLSTQALPSSCHIDVNSNQTITVTGQLKVGPNDHTYIANLNCNVKTA